ncbi:hypothetical protein KBB27_03330 [Patescibacteria group bacterium]|nr:hypothetical protein [Patescibacteria group bacterium]
MRNSAQRTNLFKGMTMAIKPVTGPEDAYERILHHAGENNMRRKIKKLTREEVQLGAAAISWATSVRSLPSERAWRAEERAQATKLLSKVEALKNTFNRWRDVGNYAFIKGQVLASLKCIEANLAKRAVEERNSDTSRHDELSQKAFEDWTPQDDADLERIAISTIDKGKNEFIAVTNPSMLELYRARVDYLKQQQKESDPVSNNDPQDPKGSVNLNPNKTVVSGSEGGANDNAPPINPDDARVVELLSRNHWSEQDFIDAIRIGDLQGPEGGYQAGPNTQLSLRFVGEYEITHNYGPLSEVDMIQRKELEAFPLINWERAHVMRARQIAIAKHVNGGGSEVRQGLGKLNELADKAERRLDQLEEAAKLAAKPVGEWVWPDDYQWAQDVCLVNPSANPLVVRPGFETCWARCQEALAARDIDLRAQADEAKAPFLSVKVLERHLGVKDPLVEKNRAPQDKPAVAAYNRWKAELLAGGTAPMTDEQVAWAQDPNALATLGPKLKAELGKRLAAHKPGNVVVVTATNTPAPKAEPDPRPSDGTEQLLGLVVKKATPASMRDTLRKLPQAIAVLAAVIVVGFLGWVTLGGNNKTLDESVLSSVDGGGAVMEPTPPPVTTEAPTEVQPSEEPSTPPAPPAPAPPTPTTAPVPVTSELLGGQPLSNVDWRRVQNYFHHVHCTSTAGELPSGNYDLRGHHCTWNP